MGSMAKEHNSFLNRILRLIFSGDDAEAIKKRQLKAIAKEIAKNKFSKWYKPNGEGILPAMGYFFYDIYKVIGPAQALLASAASSKILKVITIENNFSKEQQDLHAKLTPEAIQERAKTIGPKELHAQIKKELAVFMQGFNTKKIDETDFLYQQLNDFIRFVLFDYYFCLKKFDPALPEGQFTYDLKCGSITGEYLTDEIKDFSVLLYSLNPETNWEKVFSIITAYKNVQPVNNAQWKKLLSVLNDVRRTNILEKMLKHLTKDPSYTITVTSSPEKITDDYLKKMHSSIEDTFKKIITAQKNSQVEVMAKRVFGDQIQSGPKYYHPRSNAAFEKRGLRGYIYSDALNYLKSFLVEYFKSDLRMLFDLVLVRGQWSNVEQSAEYSNSYHTLMQVTSAILEFDEKLSEVSELGVKFRTLLSRMEREKEAGRQAQKYLGETNEAAIKIIKTAMKHIIVLGNAIKACTADYDKPIRELLQNWKEIEQHSDNPIREWMNASYTKIYHFIALEQVILKNEETT